jgi:hypothetical protein
MTTRKIRDATGGGYDKNDRFYIRVTMAPQDRQTEHAPWAASLDEVRARGKIAQEWVNPLRAAGLPDDVIEKVVEKGALAADQARLAAIAENVQRLIDGRFEPLAKPKERPDHVPGLRDAVGPRRAGREVFGPRLSGALLLDGVGPRGERPSPSDRGFRAGSRSTTSRRSGSTKLGAGRSVSAGHSTRTRAFIMSRVPPSGVERGRP